MDQRTQYFIQVLEKIGAPLLGAVMTRAPEASAQGDQKSDAVQDEAQKMAFLLSKSVQTSIAFGQLLDVNALGEHSDRVRVAMMALASNLAAEYYTSKGQPLGEAENKRMVSALQAALTFSENFMPSAENIMALEHLAAQGENVADVHQAHVQYMQAFVPVIAAVTEFTFGQKEPKIMSDIAGKLTARSESIALTLGADGKNQKRVSLGILRALGDLYASCHRAETSRLMGMSEEERRKHSPDSSLKNIWDAFELRALLLETLTKNIVGHFSGGTAASSQSPSQSAEKPILPPPEESKRISESENIQNDTSQSNAQGNPMSAFVKKSDNAQATPPTETKAKSPPADEKNTSADEESSAGQAGANPMAFFKTPRKEGQDD